MTDDRLGKALKSVGDRYVRENPAELEKVRARVGRQRFRRRLWTAVGATAASSVAVAAVFYIANIERTVTNEHPPAASTQGLRVDVEIDIGAQATEIVAAGTSAWLATESPARVLRVDADGSVAWEMPLEGPLTDILRGPSGIWVSSSERSTLVRLDQDTGAPIDVSLGTFTAPSRMHIAQENARVVTAQGVVKVPVGAGVPSLLYPGAVADVAMGNNAFWLLTTEGTIEAIDPDTGVPTLLETTSVPAADAEITFLREAIWYAARDDVSLRRIDESTGLTTQVVQLPGGYVDVDADANGLWVVTESGDGGVITELDPSDGSVMETRMEFDSAPLDLSTDDEGVWVSLADGRILRVVRD
jgi:hypothetical protein